MSACATLLLSLSACGGSRHGPTEKYYLVAANTKHGYWQTAMAGLDSGARLLGVPAEMVGPDTYDPKAEAEAFRDVVSKKPSGILVSVADPTVMKDPIDAAVAQGIPVITIDADAPASKRLTFIGTNNYQAGLMGGRVLAERLNGKGNVIVYTTPGQTNLDERLQGYQNILSNHPQIKIVRIVNDKADPRTAFDTTTEIVESKSTPDAFVCLASTSCQEVADVLDRRKVSGKIVIAMDTDPNTLTWIQKGAIAATIAQKPYTMAHFGVSLLDSLYHEKLPRLDVNWTQDTRSPLPVFVDTGATLIDKSNVEEFLKAQTPANAK
ncbi:MAG TPA: substrate-binding domain-containing protein [Bryobacteraceae bacterium]|nr:substrate-binding domain-containing protein [Bryobacteraceae bacterium]